jgi:hypothetical protein
MSAPILSEYFAEGENGSTAGKEQKFSDEKLPELLWMGHHKRKNDRPSEKGRFTGVLADTPCVTTFFCLQVVVVRARSYTRKSR